MKGLVSSIKERFKARIKVGTKVFQDFSFYMWPDCSPVGGGTVDPHTIFDVAWDHDHWDCVADGFGALKWNGCSGEYGNGSIFVRDKDGIEIVEVCECPICGKETNKETVKKYLSNLVNILEDAHEC